jgi:hypothetical protein
MAAVAGGLPVWLDEEEDEEEEDSASDEPILFVSMVPVTPKAEERRRCWICN